MNVYFNIEKLITYAKIHLLLDEANEVYVRNAIMQKLNLTEYEIYEVDEEEIEGYANPYEILDNLFAYAVDKGVAVAEQRKLFDAEIMDIVSLKPGEMADTFGSLSKNHGKALEWAYEYAIKNGAVRNDYFRWENKGDKNIEVMFADCCECKSSYPGCGMCVTGEGFGIHRAERFIPLDVMDGWYYKASKRPYFSGMGNIVSREHEQMVVDEQTLNNMFDFIEGTPGWFICTVEDEFKHANFVCGHKLLPIHKAADKRKYKSKDYQYINVMETDWYLPTLKLSCTNREKLVEFTLKLVGEYKQDGARIFVSLRKVESKFVVELSLIKGEPKKENSALAKLDLNAMAGLFGISLETQAQLKTIEKYLTKELRFTPSCLVGGMENHAKMIDRLLKEASNVALGAVEAALDVKEECKKTLVASLADIRAYNDKEMEEFLAKRDIALVK